MKFSVYIQYAEVNFLREFGYHICISVFLANFFFMTMRFLRKFYISSKQ